MNCTEQAVRKLFRPGGLPEGLKRLGRLFQGFGVVLGVLWSPPGPLEPLALPGSSPGMETNKELLSTKQEPTTIETNTKVGDRKHVGEA